MVLTGRAAVLALVGAGVVGLLVAGGMAPWQALLAVNVGLLLILITDAVRATRPGDLALVRSGDRKVRLGQEAHVELAVTNTGARRWRGHLRDAWAPTANATIDGVTDRAALDLRPGDTVRLDVAVRPTRRGDRPTDRVTLRSLGPLGLAGRQRSVEVDWSVRTLPPFSSRRHLPSRLARLRDMDGRQAIAVRAQGTEFDSLREYVPGDDVRSIDWRATARAADVMVRTWRPERDRRVVMVLDTGRTSAVRIGDETRLDICIDAGLLLAALAGRAGDRVDLVAHDRRTRLQVSGGSGPSLLPRLVDGIATLEPELTETDYRGLVVHGAVAGAQAGAGRAVRRPGPPRDGGGAHPGAAGPDRPAHGPRRLSPRACPRRPLGRISRQAAEDRRRGVYLSAARARADLDRAHVATVLARMGVRVIEATPADIAPKVADAYLDLKAAGRL